MKKTIAVIASAAVLFAFVYGCKKTNAIPLQASDVNLPVATSTATATGPTSTPTQAITPVVTLAIGPVLDDMEDNNNQNNWGGYWYTYDDLGAPNNGSSYVVPWSDARWTASGLPAGEFFMQAPGNGGTGYAARMTGYVTTAFQYGFVGMGTAFQDPKAPVNISGCAQITFWEMGDGKSYRMKISSSSPLFVNGTGDNHYGYQFVSHATWYQQTVPMTSLTQESGWGSTVARNDAMAMATDMQFQTVGQPQASIDLWVDEITFSGCGF